MTLVTLLNTHPTPSHQTRPVGLAVMCEHWTPKGDCKVTGNKERNQKMIGPKNGNRLQFYKKNPFKNYFGQKQINPEVFT